MSQRAMRIELSDEERETLKAWSQSTNGNSRLLERFQVILLAAEGFSAREIAEKLKTRVARVSKWRKRFVEMRLAGLEDAARPGKPRTYDDTTEERILALLETPPPDGRSQWNGHLLAERLGDVSDDQVWRVLRKRKIHLERRRIWCISTTSEFEAKTADVVGLYLSFSTNAIILHAPGPSSRITPEPLRGQVRLPSGKSLNGFHTGGEHNGAATLLAALEIAAVQVKAGNYSQVRRRDFVDFLADIRSEHGGEIHVILDHSRAGVDPHEQWRDRYANVHPHYVPTCPAWLNVVEVWLGVLRRQALRSLSCTTAHQLCGAIQRFIEITD